MPSVSPEIMAELLALEALAMDGSGVVLDASLAFSRVAAGITSATILNRQLNFG